MALNSLGFQNVQFLIYKNTLVSYQLQREDLYEVEKKTLCKLDSLPLSTYNKQAIVTCDHSHPFMAQAT